MFRFRMPSSLLGRLAVLTVIGLLMLEMVWFRMTGHLGGPLVGLMMIPILAVGFVAALIATVIRRS